MPGDVGYDGDVEDVEDDARATDAFIHVLHLVQTGYPLYANLMKFACTARHAKRVSYTSSSKSAWSGLILNDVR